MSILLNVISSLLCLRPNLANKAERQKYQEIAPQAIRLNKTLHFLFVANFRTHLRIPFCESASIC